LREVLLNVTINMRLWDPISSHYNEWQLPPPSLSSCTKLRLGWLPQSKLRVVGHGETEEILLEPLERESGGVLAIWVPVTPDTYYLIENRQPIGYDRSLPGSRILVLYAVERIGEWRHGKAPVRLVDADPSVPHLKGAAFDLGKDGLFRDERNGVEIRLLGKQGDSYRIRVKSERK